MSIHINLLLLLNVNKMICIFDDVAEGILAGMVLGKGAAFLVSQTAFSGKGLAQTMYFRVGSPHP